MQPQEYDKKTSFGPWTILSVYLPLNGQRLLKTQQTQGLGTLTHSSEASTSIEILVNHQFGLFGKGQEKHRTIDLQGKAMHCNDWTWSVKNHKLQFIVIRQK